MTIELTKTCPSETNATLSPDKLSKFMSEYKYEDKGGISNNFPVVIATFRYASDMILSVGTTF